MTKVIGNTTATPNPKPDWNQTDSTKADYIKNKPETATAESAGFMSAEDKQKLDNLDQIEIATRLEVANIFK